MQNIIIFAVCIYVIWYCIEKINKYFLYMSNRIFYTYLACVVTAILFAGHAIVRLIQGR